MSYDDIYRSWGRIMNGMRKGDERDRENRRAINDYFRKNNLTPEILIRELCEKNRRNNEEKIKKLEGNNISDLERWIILTEFLGTYGLLGLTGYVPSFLKRKYDEIVKKRKK
jgi:hypothetical protein